MYWFVGFFSRLRSTCLSYVSLCLRRVSWSCWLVESTKPRVVRYHSVPQWNNVKYVHCIACRIQIRKREDYSEGYLIISNFKFFMSYILNDEVPGTRRRMNNLTSFQPPSTIHCAESSDDLINNERKRDTHETYSNIFRCRKKSYGKSLTLDKQIHKI